MSGGRPRSNNKSGESHQFCDVFQPRAARINNKKIKVSDFSFIFIEQLWILRIVKDVSKLNNVVTIHISYTGWKNFYFLSSKCFHNRSVLALWQEACKCLNVLLYRCVTYLKSTRKIENAFLFASLFPLKARTDK